MSDLEDSFIVCGKCKHIRYVGDYHTACSKRTRTHITPEGVTETYWKDTYDALHELRKENNGRCPFFEEKRGLIQFIDKLIEKVTGK
jgi:hypothetical protein